MRIEIISFACRIYEKDEKGALTRWSNDLFANGDDAIKHVKRHGVDTGNYVILVNSNG